MYRDTMGEWGELIHSQGKFVDFRTNMMITAFVSLIYALDNGQK